MGRRKIEIRPIKDDRNRSVTFLKRKGGLFKKAYELSVLCSVDVAVIIFGNNKKLYEFSSGDIHETVARFQYYGGAHEHKGPADFAGKGGGDDDEEGDDEPVEQNESHSPPEQALIQHPLQHQPGLQHMRNTTPSASPPIPNGAFPQRMATPQPPTGQVHPGAQQHIPTPQQHYQQNQSHSAQPSPQPDQNAFQSPPLPQPRPLPAHARSHSIFTPVDDSRSLLAQHWGGSSSNYREPVIKTEAPRSHSVDVSSAPRQKTDDAAPNTSQPTAGVAPPPATSNPTMQAPPPGPPQRTGSLSSIPGPIRPGGAAAEAKRPRLKVQIPSEQSDGGSATADSSPKDGSTATATPIRVGQGVVLPPPSPSTNTVLSAGASGPPNPFARPAPPISTNPHVNRERDHIETPLSALPSRVMDGNHLLPSPSSFWPDAWFGRDNNMMPSPLNFQTPVVLSGPGFKEEDEKKRKAEEEAGGGGKRPKE
ncbi:uncharacterized protein M437DRAFT_42083 [Aureobasidium melanogenum CBS 110374]|uniref:MADS-box domain-containing protein n=1 Tax=Aureobasidium melanogenum (strain CBS 110374) TaxID=1043003 RepID=A0A074VX64_AURM1|nr:uncharacterized protein M437DRAFT_42083 [Aureobasidium melanogenum CBS 110374]KEQ65410.1 hypothetical protein M437DRAFT_42083 [Aureobasidium melanogenum CBS 110374]